MVLSQNQALDLAPVQEVFSEFLSESVNSVKHIKYGIGSSYSPGTTTSTNSTNVGPRVAIPHQSSASTADPSVIFYDGIGAQMVKVDFITSAILTSVPISLNYIVPTEGIRPTETGDENEVWACTQSTQTGIMVIDMGAGNILATIPVPATGSGEYPINIVFTNDGATAIEAIAYSKADSSGNMGKLVIFDTATRTLTSTLLLPLAPSALLMAPDGLTAYVLGNAGGSGPLKPEIIYYDVLSGTADLTAPFPFEAPPSGVFIHPDGTRLLCGQCVGNGLVVFDLTTRTITNTFTFTLLPGAGATTGMNMSQDGSTAAFTDILHNVYVLDTRYGNLLVTYNTGAYSLVFPGPGGN